MKKVIFIPGMHGGERDMLLIKKILREYDLIYFNYDTTLYRSIEDYSRKLDKFVRGLNLEKKEKTSIVSISAGGIIASYYTKFLDKKRVDKLITLCSPFGGSWIWMFFPKRKGVNELKPKSILLKKLAVRKSKSVQELNFWCFLDPLVPRISGRGKNSKHTLFFLHWIIQFWPPIILKAKNFLEKN